MLGDVGKVEARIVDATWSDDECVGEDEALLTWQSCCKIAKEGGSLRTERKEKSRFRRGFACGERDRTCGLTTEIDAAVGVHMGGVEGATRGDNKGGVQGE